MSIAILKNMCGGERMCNIEDGDIQQAYGTDKTYITASIESIL